MHNIFLSISSKFAFLQMLKSVAGLLFLAAAALARPQVDLAVFTPEQQLVIRQHEAIALANQPNPIADVREDLKKN